MDGHIQRFMGHLDRWGHLFTHARIISAGYIDGGRHYVQAAHIHFLPERPLDGFPTRVVGPHFWGDGELIELRHGDLDRILMDAIDGRVRAFAFDASIHHMHDAGERPEISYYEYSHGEWDDKEKSSYLDISTDSYQLKTWISGGDRNIGWRLRGLDVPFSDERDFFRHFQCSDLRGDSSKSKIRVVAHSPVRFCPDMKGTFRSECEIRLSCGPLSDKKKISVKIKKEGGGGLSEVVDVSGSNFEWAVDRDGFLGVFSCKAGGSSSLHCFLSYDNEPIQHKRLMDSVPLRGVLSLSQEIFDEDFSGLRSKLLSPKKNQGKSFEAAVSTLFSMLGFRVMLVDGVSANSDSPDYLMTVPGVDRQMLVVECTVKEPGADDQIPKIISRANLLRRSMRAQKPDIDDLNVIPVIITPMLGEDVVHHVEQAHARDVVVLCSEDLEGALGRILLPEDPREFLSEIQQKLYRSPFSGRGLA